MRNPYDVRIDTTTPAEAEARFPGSTAGIQAGLNATPHLPGHVQLGVLDQFLVAAENDFRSIVWTVWSGEEWKPMSVVNAELLHRMESRPVHWE